MNGQEINGQQVPLELKNTKIDNIRSHSAGCYFSVENPGSFNPQNPNMRMKGYGIGAGIGNGFNMSNFTSEKSGGVNLYVYTGSQPVKTIEKGYLEQPCYNSGLDPATNMANMIIEHTSSTVNSYEIRDIFMSYNSGGIYHVGKQRTCWLRHIHQPRFLKSLDGLSQNELFSFILKDNVYYMCGMYNTKPDCAVGVSGYGTVDTRGSFTVNVTPFDGRQLIFIKGDSSPWGSFYVNREDGSSNSYPFPPLKKDEYTLARTDSGIVSITKGGGTGDIAKYVTFKI